MVFAHQQGLRAKAGDGLRFIGDDLDVDASRDRVEEACGDSPRRNLQIAVAKGRYGAGCRIEFDDLQINAFNPKISSLESRPENNIRRCADNAHFHAGQIRGSGGQGKCGEAEEEKESHAGRLLLKHVVSPQATARSYDRLLMF